MLAAAQGGKTSAGKLGKLFPQNHLICNTHCHAQYYDIYQPNCKTSPMAFEISLTYLHQYNYMLLHCNYDSLQPTD